MAFKNTVNLITELERRYLECSICTEVFDEDERIPRLLPCHHPFCSECIKRLGRRKDTIKCPTCNAVHKVKKNGPIDFPKDNTRRDLTSFLQTHSDLNAFKKCCQCGNTVDVTFKCQQCNINLCELCRCQHKTENKTHELIINKSETFREEDDNLDVCQNPLHERAKVKYFCNSSNCQSVICPSCALDEHRDSSKHEIEGIEDAFEKRKNELGNDVEFLRSRILHVEATKQEVIDNTYTFQNERDEFHRKADDIYDRGIKVLEKRRKILLDNYNIVFHKKKSKLVTRKDNLDSFLINAGECCNLSEQLINRNSRSSFLNVHQTVTAHMKRYLNTPVEDSTCGENDSEERQIDVDDYLQLFERNVANLENDVGVDDKEPVIEPAKENPQKSCLTSTIATFGRYVFTKVATIFGYLFHKVKQTALYVLALFCAIKNIPVILLQNPQNQNAIQPGEGQPNERNDRRMNRDVRQMGRGNLRPNRHVVEQQQHEVKYSRMGLILRYLKGFKDITYQIILSLSVILLIHEISFIPRSIKENGNLTGLKFNTKFESQFACRSADNQTVATEPFKNLLCGSTARFFKHVGVFANASFLLENEMSIEFSIRFQKMCLQPQNSTKQDDLTVFEFGLSEYSLSMKFLFPSFLAISAFTCPNEFGVCLITGTGMLIEGQDIFKSETNSPFVEGQFRIHYRPYDLMFSFAAKSVKGNFKTLTELHRPQVIKSQTRSMRPVFAAYNYDKVNVSMTINTNEVGFDRHTLHQHLYISDDNKTISNKKLSDTFSSNNSRKRFIFTLPKTLKNLNIIQTMINIDFVASNDAHSFFKIGVGENEHGKFVGTELSECIKCKVKYFFGFYHTTGYCLSINNDSSPIVIGNQLSFFLHYTRNGIIEMFIRNYFFGYSSYIFKSEQFNKHTFSFYVENNSANNVVISSSDYANIIDSNRICLGLFLGAIFLIFRKNIKNIGSTNREFEP